MQVVEYCNWNNDHEIGLQLHFCQHEYPHRCRNKARVMIGMRRLCVEHYEYLLTKEIVRATNQP